MIERNDGKDLLAMIPAIHEVEEIPELNIEGEGEPVTLPYQMGELLYCKKTDELVQYMLVDYNRDTKTIKEIFKDIVGPIVDAEGNEMTNQKFIETLEEFKNNIKEISKTSESNNLGYYLSKIDKELLDPTLTFKQRNDLERKKNSILDSVTMRYLTEVTKEPKFNKDTFKRYKKLSMEKLKANKKYSFPPLNDELLTALKVTGCTEKECKMFLLHLYKFIATKELEANALKIYFTLINILGINMEVNNFKESMTVNLRNKINYFNGKRVVFLEEDEKQEETIEEK